uniref:Uncharacterized protein n=1 Tax=Branchiostoma floridae TaxID=7739 RepID=C3Y452_BRAFL|eukprot:XP_002609068.1 hypothetical protein BRAFLDRAFT_96909 [Branchiostoma floridae]
MATPGTQRVGPSRTTGQVSPPMVLDKHLREHLKTARDAFLSGTLPDGFLWGTATAAFQIEGGWDSGEKGPSIWDWYSHLPQNVPWGDVATDSYHKYKEDVQMHVNTSLNSYRFSISWPRLFPDGTNTTINQYGVDYYNNLINELQNNGIEPLVTLYHWDLPQKLKERYGGWVNDTLVEMFENYARFCFTTFGDRVKYWTTFNEPWSFVAALGDFNNDPDYTMKYKMAHNVIRAHARAWHTYDDDFRSAQNGSVGIVISSIWGEPADLHNPADRQAATNYMEFFFGWFANPIIGNGDYPDVMKRMVRESRLKQNQTVSPLPEFTEEEKMYNKGTTDFLGINTYTARIISATNETQTCHPDNHNFASACGFMPDLMGVKETVGPGWFYMGSNIFWFAPWNIRGILHFVRERSQGLYGSIARENGFPDNAIHVRMTREWWQWCHMDEAYAPTRHGYVEPTNKVRPSQIEGGWDSGEKGPSIWDWYSHLPQNVPWGDVATDSYHKLTVSRACPTHVFTVQRGRSDAVNTSLNSYRFSISWPRLFPDGTNTTINQYGVDYYNNLINELQNNGIEPLVTLYHWDLPQKLKERYGGWVNDTLVELFENYARFCFTTFGDRVKYWTTFNEPWSFVAALGDFNDDPDYTMRYKMAHNVIRAHARAWHTYDDDFRSAQNGSVGIVISSIWGEPADLHNPADRQAATNYMEFFFGWFANPIIGNGDYPDVMKRMVRESRKFIIGINGEQQQQNKTKQKLQSISRDAFLSGTLPDGFLWGTATASFQIEGGWDSGEKGPSIWDWYSHLPQNVPWGDVATDSYHKYKEDVQMHVDTGLNSYRFSLSWPRLFPDGTNATINQYGVDYYNSLINELKNNGIEPLVTLYHWDLPQKLKERYGGWVNDTLVELFENYARFCFATFGDRVKYWTTFNEPWSFVAALGDFNYDPDYTMRYKMAHNVIRAHARAWHTYDDDFRSAQNGSIGIVISSMWGEPADLHSPADRQAATNYMEFFFGWFANPIIGNGDYPDVMKRMVRESRLKQNQTVSPLPEFTEEEKVYNNGTTDFLGINTYTARIISATNETQTCHPVGQDWYKEVI